MLAFCIWGLPSSFAYDRPPHPRITSHGGEASFIFSAHPNDIRGEKALHMLDQSYLRRMFELWAPDIYLVGVSSGYDPAYHRTQIKLEVHFSEAASLLMNRVMLARALRERQNHGA